MFSTAFVAADRLTNFELPRRPEGITEGPGNSVYVSQIDTGEVLALDAISGAIQTVVISDPYQERQAWGLEAYKGAIFVAGGGVSFLGGTAEVYVYDATTGDTITTCGPLSTNNFGDFLNDVTVRNGILYVTDSFNGKLMTLDADEALAGKCIVGEVDLPDPFDPENPDEFGANGVVPYADGLLVSQESDGSVWYIFDLDAPLPSFEQIIPDSGVMGADGLTIQGNRLYVTQNTHTTNRVAVYQLEKIAGSVSATFLGALTSDDFAGPATSTVFGGYVYSTNSQFF